MSYPKLTVNRYPAKYKCEVCGGKLPDEFAVIGPHMERIDPEDGHAYNVTPMTQVGWGTIPLCDYCDQWALLNGVCVCLGCCETPPDGPYYETVQEPRSKIVAELCEKWFKEFYSPRLAMQFEPQNPFEISNR